MNTETETQKTQTGSLIERLFAAGAHFGFTKSRRHPTVEPYLFGSKQGTDIFDLEKVETLLIEAADVVKEAGKGGKTILFVGTKEEINTIVKGFAEMIEMPSITNRWIGGVLTNFSEIKKRIARLHELTAQGVSGELERKYTKKERVVIGRELEKLTYNFDGIKAMERMPALLVIVDPRHNSIAVEEAQSLNIPVIGVMSSDASLRDITYPVLVNDSLQSSISLVLNELTEAFLTGKRESVAPRSEA